MQNTTKIMNYGDIPLVKTLDEVMCFLENYTLAWHHWLMVLSLVKLGGSGKKSQILPVYKQEGFSPHVIDKVFQTDLEDLGDAIQIQDGILSLTDNSIITLTDDIRFQKFLKKHIKSVISTFKQRRIK